MSMLLNFRKGESVLWCLGSICVLKPWSVLSKGGGLLTANVILFKYFTPTTEHLSQPDLDTCDLVPLHRSLPALSAMIALTKIDVR